MPLKVVAFDVDSTLTDFLRFKRLASDAAALAMLDAGLDMDPALAMERLWETYREAGLDDDVAFRRFLETTVGRVDQGLLEAAIHSYLRAKDTHLMPYPRTVEALIGLVRRGLRLAVVTDAPRDKAMRRLAALRLTPFFDLILTRDDTLRGKADEQPFLLLCRRMGVRPGEVLMVGDHPERDIRNARKAGLRTAHALYGAQPHYATAFPFDQADFKLRRIDEVLGAVDALLAEDRAEAGRQGLAAPALLPGAALAAEAGPAG
jgi:putative hydrolase of the HAD superfamily